jgi:hypothetical protein
MFIDSPFLAISHQSFRFSATSAGRNMLLFTDHRALHSIEAE